MLFQKVAVLCFIGSGLARSLQGVPRKLKPRQDPTPTAGAPAALSTACGDIIEAVDDPRGFSVFWAQDAYACLESVPFNPAVASRFVKYWNETLQFQSTLAYLKNPPPGYQQPAVDVPEELAAIQNRIDTGFYTNQYAFEADFQLFLYAMHDGHVSLVAGVLSAFSFGSPFEIVSVSRDGKEAPKVYLTADIIDSQTEGWTPSPIKTINGEDVIDYLTRFSALNSLGYIEPHAEWNAIMSSPALDIQSGQTIFSGGATFYPGDNLTVHFENYTAEDDTTFYDTIWVAVYNEVANYTGPLTTGGDFYNYFVLGNLPASFDPDRIIEPEFFSAPEAAPGNWSEASFGAYPEAPDVAQAELGPTTPGLVSGYFYEDISTGVLSLPSFDAIADSVGNYSDAVGGFISKASDAGLKNVIIDLQQNHGGLILLAYTTFKFFFPDLLPFAGSRRRIHPLANALGSVTTDFWEALDETDEDELAFKLEMGAFEWLITNRINAATGKNFTSWDEYATVINANDDTFSQTEQYDLANMAFDQAAFDQWIPTMYIDSLKDKWPWTTRHWEPDHITLLTDGSCSSACALFVEMMTRAGVKTVVAGGRPQTGPMQAVGGNRGANLYGADALDDDMLFVRAVGDWIDEDVNATVPEVRDPAIFTKFASVNLRDQIRKGDTTPLQFKYEAADCRIYYTIANVYNMTRLWHDVAAAAADPSLCVEGSTGFSTTNPNPAPPPAPTADRPTLDKNNPVIEKVQFEDDPDGGLRAADGTPRGDTEITLCPASALEGQSCSGGKGRCQIAPIKCPGETQVRRPLACLPKCSCNHGVSCRTCPGTCNVFQVQENKEVSGGFSVRGNIETAKSNGLCFPTVGTRKLGCPARATRPKAKPRPGAKE